MDKPDELLLTPASLLLPPASEVILLHKGPQMKKSATTALSGLIRPSVMRSATNANRSAVATASARIGTILVVALVRRTTTFSTPTAP